MHADDRSGLDRIGSLNLLQVNHRHPGMGIAFRASLNTRIAADTPTGVDVELPITHLSMMPELSLDAHEPHLDMTCIMPPNRAGGGYCY